MLHFSTPKVALHHADCMEALREMEENSIDACVTDPPYETGFMAKKWDKTGIAYQVATWVAILRVLKPGAHLLSFGGTRTHHRMVCAVEDAGFEIRDEIDWITGQGFPKSLNFDGAWNGWGTALKPAKEPICLARKPVIGTIEANLLAFGTGALNINGCRVEHNEDLSSAGDGQVLDTQAMGWGFKRVARDGQLGRWPANLIHDGSPEVLAAFPEAQGQQGRAKLGGDKRNNIFGNYGENHTKQPDPRGDSGSAARFFYCPKASRSDREEGLDRYEIVIAQCSAWGNEDQKARLLVDTGQSPPRVIDVSGAPNNSASEWSMFLFGNHTTALSLMGSKSIIKTKTNSITSSKILSWFQTSLTSGYTEDANGEMESAGNHAESADDSFQSMIITSAAMVSVHGAVAAASTTRWKISASDACPPSSAAELVDREVGSAGMDSPRAGAGRTAKNGRRNIHPTVKPTVLMRYLCRLITPPGGVVLDPFTGSGSTGKAALLEGFRFIGIEREEPYVKIAAARLGQQPTVFADWS